MPVKPDPNYSSSSSRLKTLQNYLNIFFSDDVSKLLTKQTIRYSRQKNNISFTVSANEINCFLGVLLLSGYNVVPNKRNYWEIRSDVRNVLVCNAMRRDTFFEIMKYFHCADNTCPIEGDKMYKLRPLMNLLK